MSEKTLHIVLFILIAIGLFVGFWFYERGRVMMATNSAAPLPMTDAENDAPDWTTPYYLSYNTVPVAAQQAIAAQVTPPVVAPGTTGCWPFSCSGNGIAGTPANI